MRKILLSFVMALMFLNVSVGQVVNGVMGISFNQSYETIKTHLYQTFPAYSIKLDDPFKGSIKVSYSIEIADVKFVTAKIMFIDNHLHQILLYPEEETIETYTKLVNKFSLKYKPNREIVDMDNIIPYQFFCGISKRDSNCFGIRIGYSNGGLFVSYELNASSSWGVYIKEPPKTIKYDNF